MGKRSWSLVLAAALIAGVFSALPAKAQEAPPAVVPTVVNIEDPQGDANYINDQGVGLPVPGDQVGTDQFGTVSDILKGWLSSDATTVSAHIVTNAAPPASTPLIFHMRVDPGSGTNCLWFRASFPSAVQGQTDPVVPQAASLRDTCTDDVTTDAELTVGTTADGDGVITITVPKSASAAFIDGNVLKTPTADSRNYPGGKVTLPQVDNTLPGTDFTITSGGPIAGGPGEPVKPTPPGKNDPPGKGKKKGCGKGKGKGKQKGACPGGKPGKPTPTVVPSCPAYVPGDEGKEAATTVVTDAATAEKPVEVDLTAGAGGGAMPIGGTPVPYDETSSVYQNIQVDAADPSAGLYVRFEFPDRHDYDLYLNYPDGSTAANSGDANAAPGEGLGGGSPDGGWEAGSNYEQVMGIATADCAGYTARMVSFLTNGGAVKLKVWLGDVVAEPVAPGGSQALTNFFDLTGIVNPSAMARMGASGTPAATKGCTKGKGKKKGCKKPPVASCAPLTTGDQGAGKPTVVVTDAATAEAPVEQTVTLGQSTADFTPTDATYDYFNVQIDSAAASAGLYVTFEFDTRRDYDLYARWTDASEAASSHGFNPAIEAEAPEPVPLDPSNQRTNHAGDSNADSENLVGVITPDCGGYTIETVNWLGEGGEFTVKLWLGEGTTEPLAPGERPA